MLEPTEQNKKQNSEQNTDEAEESNAGLCPKFHYAVELIGKRWTGAIINVFLKHVAEGLEPDGIRFHSIRTAIPELSDRMLSERLKELEIAGIIIREVYPETPVRVEYKLTSKGHSLKPIMDSIGQWSQEWVE